MKAFVRALACLFLFSYNTDVNTRTKSVEEFAEAFASIPLVRECVFRSPKRLDRGIEKEVCDLLIELRGESLLLQMKCQEDPSTRWGEKLGNWVLKQTHGALAQIRGAIDSVAETDTWCDHPRRGLVTFRSGELHQVCGIVAVENFGDRVALPLDFPLEHRGVPIAYFSVNDFLNVVHELRAFPEIVGYLLQRATLPADSLLAIGGERFLFHHYLTHGFSFDRWMDFAQAAREAYSVDPFEVVREARRGNEGARLIEKVADDLAERAADYLEGMPPEFAQRYDPPAQRCNYLRMQENLCDLSLSGRKAVGQQLLNVINKVQANSAQDMAFGAAYADTKPDFLYVLAASRGIHRSEVMSRGVKLLHGGLAHYGKNAGMFIADRDSKGFEITYMADVRPTAEAVAVGHGFFGHLRMFDF